MKKKVISSLLSALILLSFPTMQLQAATSAEPESTVGTHSCAFDKTSKQFSQGENHYIIETVYPTCTTGGYTAYRCPDCKNEQYRFNLCAPLGHNCAGGFSAKPCSRCGKYISLGKTDNTAMLSRSLNRKIDNRPLKQYASSQIKCRAYGNSKNVFSDQIVTNKLTTINTDITYQSIDGFGASGCWWAQEVGSWNNKQIDKITELLYGDTGAGLDIYRYNLGGGSEKDTHIGDWHRRAEDFLTPSSDINDVSTYNMNADKAARKVLASAQKANNALKVTLFSNSAPSEITRNGLAYCSNGINANLDKHNYSAFANYIINCAQLFIDEGYNVTTVSPINEPEWDWAADENGNCSQEGCHWEVDSAVDFYNNYMIPAIKNSSLNGKLDLSVWESGQLNHWQWWNAFLDGNFSSDVGFCEKNEGIREYADAIDVHSYWASDFDKAVVANQLKNPNYSSIKKVRCTEYCQMTGDGNSGTRAYLTSADNNGDGNGMDIYFALALADKIHQDLTVLSASEWDWWLGCSSGVYPDGLVYIDYDNHDNIKTAKRLWAMGNFARFIDVSAKRIDVKTEAEFGKHITTGKKYVWADEWGNSDADKSNYIEQSAYLNPDGSVVVVYINNSDTDEFTAFNNDFKSLETYVTDKSRDLKKYQTGECKGTVVHIPCKSITTVVLK